MRKPALPRIEKEELIRLINVFFIALSVIACEIVAFQTLSFVNDYMSAMQAIPQALIGISVGGLISFFIPKAKTDFLSSVILFLFPLLVMGTFPVIIRLNSAETLMTALLTGPYILGSLYISLAFNHHHPGRVYLFDLVGAGFGSLVAVVAIPFLREEGSFFLLGILSSVPLLLSVFLGNGTRRPVFTMLAVVPLSLAMELLGTHLIADPFNMMRTASTEDPDFGDKIFNFMKQKDGTPVWDLLYSRGSLVERIDIVKLRSETTAMVSVYNGRQVDGINNFPSSPGALDYRLPTRLRLGQNPSTLLVGPSGQGLCKAVQALGEGHVDAVEINGAIADLMTHELAKASANAYSGFNLVIGDVRTFIERVERKYDFITMLNTHRIWSMGHLGAPEYIHTIEAMKQFIGHLTDQGFLILEERNINEQADLGIRRLVRTAKEALKESGVKDPSKHFMIWERHHDCVKEKMFADPPNCNPRTRFTFVGVKKTPITDAEYTHLIEWEKALGEIPSTTDYSGFRWRYLPQKPTNHYWTEVVLKDNLYDIKGANKDLHNLEIITDDKPFPFDIFKLREPAWSALRRVSFLAALMVLLPTIIAFFSLRRKSPSQESAPRRYGLVSLLVSYFSLLGIAYLIVEMVLIQKFGIFLSSPVWSMAVVLSTMLTFSGLGGYLFRDLRKKKDLFAFVALLALGFALWQGLDTMLSTLMPLPFAARILAAVILLGPLSFMMGIPFPFAMSLSKRELTERHAGLFFGINGAFGAAASPLTLILSMAEGFKTTFGVGLIAYVACGLLLGVIILATNQPQKTALHSISE
jgi:hypothetical protein